MLSSSPPPPKTYKLSFIHKQYFIHSSSIVSSFMLPTLSLMIKRKNVRRPKFVKLQPHEIFRLLFWLAFKPSLPPYLRAIRITYCELRWSICQMFLLSLIQKLNNRFSNCLLINPLDAGELFCPQILYNLDMLWTVGK